ncbi:MAG: hypothetical protein QOI15_232, partial [Pseudonocardiales bacterium]|nr:hypothetical protein [Pseudonocardiales bacterium]
QLDQLSAIGEAIVARVRGADGG